MECPICMENYSSDQDLVPKFMPCGHTACVGCLRHVQNCPKCRKEFYGPSDALPTNYDFLSVDERSSGSSSGDAPGGRGWWCTECDAAASAQCRDSHSILRVQVALRRQAAKLAPLASEAVRGLENAAQAAAEEPACAALQLLAGPAPVDCELTVRQAGSAFGAQWRLEEGGHVHGGLARALLCQLAARGLLQPAQPQKEPPRPPPQQPPPPQQHQQPNIVDLVVEPAPLAPYRAAHRDRQRELCDRTLRLLHEARHRVQPRRLIVVPRGARPPVAAAAAAAAAPVAEARPAGRVSSSSSEDSSSADSSDTEQRAPRRGPRVGPAMLRSDSSEDSSDSEQRGPRRRPRQDEIPPEPELPPGPPIDELNVGELSDTPPDQRVEDKADLLQRVQRYGVRRLVNVFCSNDGDWALRLLRAAADSVEELKLLYPRAAHLLAVHQCRALRRLYVWSRQEGCALDAERPVLPALAAGTAGLQWLRVLGLPRVTLESLLRAHAASLRTLWLWVGSAGSGRWPNSCRDLDTLLAGCGLARLEKLRLERVHCNPCAPQVDAVRRALPAADVACAKCGEEEAEKL